METIWIPNCSLENVHISMVKRGDNLDYLKTIVEDGTMEKHKRLNTIERISTLVLDPDAPKLHDAMTMEKEELEKQRGQSLLSLPKTTEEHFAQQLDQASQLYKTGIIPAEWFEPKGEVEEEMELEVPEQEDEEEEEEAIPTMFEEDEILWPFPSSKSFSAEELTWVKTIWYRINMAHKMVQKDRFVEYKVMRFINAHLPVVQYLDALSHDEILDVKHLCSLYSGLGPSTFDDDKDLFQVKRTVIKVKLTPLEVLQRDYPNHLWVVEEVINKLPELKWSPTITNGFVEWTPIDAVSPKTHSIYLSCIYILNQIHTFLAAMDDTHASETRDALWTYYCSFTDLFYACLPSSTMDDKFLLTPVGSEGCYLSENLSPWEMYGTNLDIRTFHAGDLPDFFHIINSIPLWGEQQTPTYRMGKIYQKSYPYACQRRHLIKLILKTINEEPGPEGIFWTTFSQLFWCMLTGLYPGEFNGTLNGGLTLCMRDLLRIKQLTSSKDLLTAAISAQDPTSPGVPSGANGAPLVVFIVFRLHILYMASLNPTYIHHAEKCIDWTYFKSNTIELASIVRSTSLFPEDPFAQARKQLSKTVKSPHSRVHRWRKHSMAVCLTEHLNNALEKTIIQDKHNRIVDLASLKTIRLDEDVGSRLERFKNTMVSIDFVERYGIPGVITIDNMNNLLDRRLKINEAAGELYAQILSVKCKAAILNLLIRIPPADRLKLVGFSILTLPEYGGLSQKSVQSLCTLCDIYFNNAVPKDIRQCINDMSAPHLVVACFYFNMVSLMEKIHFVTLDADTVQRIDYAMINKRYHIYPGQVLPEAVYDVCIALCCEKICNLMGQGKFGDKKVAYDMESQLYVCADGKSMHAHNKLSDDDDDSSSSSGEEDDDDDDPEGEGDDDEEEDIDLAARLLEAQTDVGIDDIMASMGGGDMTADASKKKGRGTVRSKEMEDRKRIRTERKVFNRIPCNQPVITISLRGRALIWGNTLNKKCQFMHCPQCGALHMYTILNFSGAVDGKYRCNECARKEITHLEHRKCAYCSRSGPPKNLVPEKCKLFVTSLVEGEESIQWLYFCRSHFGIAKRYAKNLTKTDLWIKIKEIEEKRLLEHASKKK